MFQTKVVEKTKTHVVIFFFFFAEIRAVYDIVRKTFVRVRQDT
jgi:hypothetical protein